jgi:hypothetical protein
MAIRKNDEFEAIYPTLDLDGLTFLDIVDRIEQEIRQKYGSRVTQESLNNCRGTWNELAFIMEAHRSIGHCKTSKSGYNKLMCFCTIECNDKPAHPSIWLSWHQ